MRHGRISDTLSGLCCTHPLAKPDTWAPVVYMRRLLIIGCGDVAMRMLPLVRDRYRIYALSHSPERFARMRESGVVPISL